MNYTKTGSFPRSVSFYFTTPKVSNLTIEVFPKLFPGAVFGVLPQVIEFVKEENEKNNPFDAVFFDSFALAGFFLGKIFNIPAIRSSSSFIGAYEENLKDFYQPEVKNQNRKKYITKID